MKEILLNYTVRIYDSASELPETSAHLIQLAREAATRAYAPYSGYQVGAAVLLANGEIITGNNQENSAYPSGLCAERTALFYASAQFPGVPVRQLAISASAEKMDPDTFAKPCGGCRQVISEYEDLAGSPITILLDGPTSVTVVEGVDTLLPFRFKKEELHKP
ncbi:MAG: cytidine deaminase [Marinilabiliales bacterium]|nr:cytidine deaminase [Marinilabiliales bacterium]